MSALSSIRSKSAHHTTRAIRRLSVLLIALLLGVHSSQIPVQAAAPVAYDQSVATAEDTPLEIILGADDEDGDALGYTIVTYPLNGDVSGMLPALTYTPNPNFYGSDSFAFQANAGGESSNLAMVSINVTSVNDAPVAVGQAVTTAEDTSLAITLTAADVENDPLTFVIVDAPANGTLGGSAPNVTYTPNANYNGSDSFSFRANDGDDSNLATVTITITPAADAPVADAQSVLTAQNTPTAITLTASDADGDELTYLLDTYPTNGALTGTPPNLTYTPTPGFNGSDSFTFYANDGALVSNIATVSITVSDPPVAAGQALTTDEDTAVSTTLTAADTEGDPLTYSIVDGPANGVLSGTLPTITYTPNADFNGSDSFTFNANDGHQDSNTATVSITVNPVIDPPVAHDQAVTTDEDTLVGITLTATDPDGDPLTYTLLTGPTNGVLGGTVPNLTYTPNPNFYGSDSLTFKVNDADFESNTATVSITINAVNDPPIADDQSVTTDEDTPVDIVLTAGDIDQDPLSYYITDPPTHGTLSGTAPDLVYTPHPDYFGSDTVGFRANDGAVDSETAWITVEIAPVNDPPVANEQSVTADEDSSRGITLTGSDVEGDPLTYAIAIAPADGILTGTPPYLTYTPAGNYYGPDAFTFVVTDTAGLTDTAQVQITVINVNDNPRTTRDNFTVQEDSGATDLNVLHNDTYLPDPFETLTIANVTSAAHGQVAIRPGGSLVAYTPNEDYYGTDSFAYTIVDGHGGSATATVLITVTNENDPPLALPDNASMDEDAPAIEIDVLANDTYLPDPPEDLTIVSFSAPANGTVRPVSGAERLSYQPDPNFHGRDTFTYRIHDRSNGYSTSIVRVEVRAVNDPPVAEDDDASTSEDAPVTIDVLANDTDVDGLDDLDPASVQIVDGPDHGDASVNSTNGRVTYDPAPDWNGSDVMTYRVCDRSTPTLCDEAQISVSVGSVNDPPVSDAGEDQTVDTNARVTLDGSGSYDPDGNLPLAYLWSRIGGPAVVLTDPTAESPSFVAPADPCVLTFMLQVIDYDGRGKADLTPDVVVITVENQAPISNAGPDRIEQIDSVVTLDGTASSDPDGDLPLEYLWTQSGGPGVVLDDPTLPSPSFTAPSTAAVLTFTLHVTDTFGEPDATPDQIVVTISEPYYVYLPSVVARHVIAPDLVIESLTATQRNVQLVIRNQGNAPVTDAFWVDVYINPTRPPSAVNEIFDDLGTQGLAWAVRDGALDQLVPGGTLTLRLNDQYYDPDISVFPGSLEPGTPLYAQVDSFNPSTYYGTVLESHEAIGAPYNNIYGPVLSDDAAAAGSEWLPPTLGRPAPVDLPTRR